MDKTEKKVKYTCIECKKVGYYIDDSFGPRMYEGVYNTGVGNKQMHPSCARKRFSDPWIR